MELEYILSDAAIKQLFTAGQDYGLYRSIEFQLSDLTPENREAWYEMFGTSSHEKLRPFLVSGGKIYSDGSVDSSRPIVAQSCAYLPQDKILVTPEDINKVIADLYVNYKQARAEFQDYLPKWEHALQAYNARKTEREKQREAEEKAKELMQPTIDRLNARIRQLENALRKLIRRCTDEQLEAAGFYKPVPEEEEIESTEAQEQALRVLGLDDC